MRFLFSYFLPTDASSLGGFTGINLSFMLHIWSVQGAELDPSCPISGCFQEQPHNPSGIQCSRPGLSPCCWQRSKYFQEDGLFMGKDTFLWNDHQVKWGVNYLALDCVF
jgi:hypothetical protein